MTSVYLSCQISGIHWWYQTASHAAELTCGYYNTSYRDGYSSIAQMFAKHNATFNFTCVELLTSEQRKHCPQAKADPEGLVSQVQKHVLILWFMCVDSQLSRALIFCYNQTSLSHISFTLLVIHGLYRF